MYAAQRRWHPHQLELDKQVVVLCPRALALEDLDEHGRAYVKKCWDFFVGTKLPHLMSGVIIPPAVSMPSESGAMSMRRRLCVRLDMLPERTAAPYATTSSRLMLFKLLALCR
jgi:hypothetical protein